MAVRILCVEDNPQNMRLVRKILKSQGYDVIEAEDGFSGLNKAETESPDLILMDINLPDIDGLEVTRRIKAQPHLKPIPIVALTANAMFGDEERCLEAGCDGYIAKPVSKHKLISNLKIYLDTRGGDFAFDVEADSTSDIQSLLKLNKAHSSQTSEESDNALEEPVEASQEAIEVSKSVNGLEEPVVEGNNTNSNNNTNGQSETLPNVSAFQQANRRHQFRKSSGKSNPNSANEPDNPENELNN